MIVKYLEMKNCLFSRILADFYAINFLLYLRAVVLEPGIG
jgi:hypothetical protein